ncbi:hypothetical protein BLA6860_07482 [Burkholderia lata]|nr:hypothetical protein BLA6860_07482 [Burkholderia lata]
MRVDAGRGAARWRGGERRTVAGCGDSRDQRGGVERAGAVHRRALGREVDGRTRDARHGGQRLFNAAGAGRAGHPADVEFEIGGSDDAGGCRRDRRAGNRRRAIAGLFHGFGESGGGHVGRGVDGGPFGREVDRRARDARHLRQRLLDARHAGRAGHPVDVEFDAGGRGRRRRCERGDAAIRYGRRRAVAGLFHRVHQLRGGNVRRDIDGSPFGREIDRRARDARHLLQRLFDTRHARCTGHPVDIEFDDGAVDRRRVADSGSRSGHRRGRRFDRMGMHGRGSFEHRCTHGGAIASCSDRIDELCGFDRFLRSYCCRVCVEVDRRVDDARHRGQRPLHAARTAAAMHAVDAQLDRMQRCGGKWFSHVGFPECAALAANDPSINIPMMVRSSGA